MLFFGHIAVSLLLADVTKTDRTAAVVGNLVPDVTDKTGGWVLKVMPAGRWFAHGLPCFTAVVAAAKLVLPEKQWRAFALGYAGHLVCDLYAGGKVPWFAPFETPPKVRHEKKSRAFWIAYLAADVVGAAITWRLLRPKDGFEG
jgi:hypothetical protein